MSEFYIGLGLTALVPFVQWIKPIMPKTVAWFGAGASVLIAVAGLLPPEMRPSLPSIVLLFVAALCVGGSIHLWRWPKEKKLEVIRVSQARGGKGGSGEIFGNNGTIIGGKGGRVGFSGEGRGGDGGGGVIHGDGGTIIGGEGGSVDGINIWYPPAQSGYIQYLESQGQTPDFNVQYPGAGGATGGWIERQQVVVKIREEYFKKMGQASKVQSSKIGDVPLEYINEELKEAGYLWRARIDKKYWYLYFVPNE